jgi:serine/threonine protein phosphatase PrpC
MGSRVPGSCAECESAVSSSDNFCEACGRPLDPAAVSAAPSAAAVCEDCRSSRISADGYCEDCGRKASSGRDHLEIDLGMLCGITDRGLRHHRNEDAMRLVVAETPSGTSAVAVVADGVSTSDRPDEASLAAADRAIDVLATALSAGSVPEEALISAAAAADVAVRALDQHSGNAPAATFVAAVASADAATICWVGDSRAYWLPADGPGASLLTRDDSLAEELIAAGAAETDVLALPHAHVITRWLGADADPPSPHTARFEPPGRGALLICSDGLWNYQPDADSLRRLAMPGALTDLPGATSGLVTFALDSGGQDNITVVLIAFPLVPAGAATSQRSSTQ